MPSSPNVSGAHTAIYRRWRAQTFAEIVGQRAVVETLRNAVRLDRVGHAYLFVGPRGTGKTSTARILAKAINCTDLRDGDPCDRCPSCVAIREGTALDVAEFDAASNNTVGDMRELLPRVYTTPTDLRSKVFIVDEVQRITQGWDVLLKTLEEPPDHVLFVFCTTDPSQIRPAVISRVQRFTFRPLSVEQIVGKLSRILAELGRRAEPDAVQLIAELASGGMRDAESMLDQLLAAGADPITAEDVRAQLGMADAAQVDAFLEAFLTGDALAGIQVLDALEAEGRDVRLLVDQCLERFRGLIHARLRSAADAGPGRGVDVTALAVAARALAGALGSHATSGSGRFQLELALFAGPAGGPLGVPGGRDIRGAAEARLRSRPAPAAIATVTPAGPSTEAPLRSRSIPPTEPELEPGPVPAGPPAAPLAIPEPPVGSPATAARAASGEPSAGPDHARRTVPRPVDSQRPVEAGPPGQEPPVVPIGPGRDEPGTDAPVEGQGDVLARLRAGWADVVTRVSRNPANRPLIEACVPTGIEGQVVILGFPEEKAFLRDIAERKRGSLEDGISAVLGAPFGVRCVATNLEGLPPLPRNGGTRDVLEHARRIFAGDIVEPAEIE